MESQVTLKVDRHLLNQMQGECRKRETSLTKEFTKWLQWQVAQWEREYAVWHDLTQENDSCPS